MTGGIPPAMPFAVVRGRVGVVVTSREGRGARRVARGIVKEIFGQRPPDSYGLRKVGSYVGRITCCSKLMCVCIKSWPDLRNGRKYDNKFPITTNRMPVKCSLFECLN
jgi:hypothetical protein